MFTIPALNMSKLSVSVIGGKKLTGFSSFHFIIYQWKVLFPDKMEHFNLNLFQSTLVVFVCQEIGGPLTDMTNCFMNERKISPFEICARI